MSHAVHIADIFRRELSSFNAAFIAVAFSAGCVM